MTGPVNPHNIAGEDWENDVLKVYDTAPGWEQAEAVVVADAAACNASGTYTTPSFDMSGDSQNKYLLVKVVSAAGVTGSTIAVSCDGTDGVSASWFRLSKSDATDDTVVTGWAVTQGTTAYRMFKVTIGGVNGRFVFANTGNTNATITAYLFKGPMI